MGTHLRDAGDEYSGLLQLERCRVRLVTCRDHYGACARQNAIAVQPGARRAGQHDPGPVVARKHERALEDRKSTRLNSSHQIISYAVFCLKKTKYIWEPQSPHCG